MAAPLEVTTTDVVIPTEIPTSTRGLTGVLAVPDGAGPWPAVVMVHEAFGLTDEMRTQVVRLASAGYVVLMPDLFTAGGARKCLVATFRALMSGSGRAFDDIESARRFVAGRADVTGGTGVIGFCMGGGFALMTASRGFAASSVNYGQLPKELDAVLVDACPIVASFGGRDRSLKGAAARLEAGLERARVPHDVKEYPEAGHSFLDETLPGPAPLRPLLRVMGAGPSPVDAADAWERIEAFFAEHLAPSGTRSPGSR